MIFKRLRDAFIFCPLLLWGNALFQEPWGKDSDLHGIPQSPSPAKEFSLGVQVADLVIQFHQKIISPADGPRSHYRPSSSQYMKLAMHRYGFFKGYVMGFDRLLRENDEEWVYRYIQTDHGVFKYDPASLDKNEQGYRN